jgi:hypothetical protein
MTAIETWTSPPSVADLAGSTAPPPPPLPLRRGAMWFPTLVVAALVTAIAVWGVLSIVEQRRQTAALERQACFARASASYELFLAQRAADFRTVPPESLASALLICET